MPASRALARPGRVGGRSQAERAIQLLRAAIDNGFINYDHMQEDSDLDPIRGLPAFGELMKAGYPEGRHAAVWISDRRFEKAACYGLDAEAHLRALPRAGRPRIPTGLAFQIVDNG